jgi:restriction system protein
MWMLQSSRSPYIIYCTSVCQFITASEPLDNTFVVHSQWMSISARSSEVHMKKGPQFVRYFGPVIEALKELGGSGRPTEVCDLIAQRLKISEQERSILNKGGQSKYENRVHWARFYLAKAGYVGASTRGVWSLTEKSQVLEKMSFEEAMMVFSTVQSQFDTEKATVDSDSTPVATDENIAPSPTAASSDTNYRSRLLNILQALPASGFERLCQRLLRESGFEKHSVTAFHQSNS